MYYTNVHDYVKLLPRTKGTNCIIPITNVRIKCGFLRHSIVVVVVVATCFRIAVEYAWIVAKIKYVPTYIFVCLEPTRQPHWRICTPVGLKDWLVVCSFAWSIVHTSRHRQTYLYIYVWLCVCFWADHSNRVTHTSGNEWMEVADRALIGRSRLVAHFCVYVCS